MKKSQLKDGSYSTIAVSKKTKKRLALHGKKDDTYDDVVVELLEAVEHEES